ncbi:SDR family NAD(P)-dependent oxidoreductase [Paenibacillus nasutitermitis]|uniref:Beta-ketoacyl-ACP reductase n=1 Tax=Paenibacillus nasutitermitis TaxID=1652958 RepID=A0A917DY29_9BACL|nr:SDR family oxidoreductase [Paenibacillus nasutitermitis]GGD78495.1 beta-ketoacyl-ACP reductase [Paenibacillus nasutitermitis]
MERKVALVTGSGRGIGKGIALAFAAAGYEVCVNYNTSREKALAVVEEIRALGVRAEAVQADISTMEGVSALFDGFSEKFDRLDVHVNNSGITRMKPFLETTPELFDEVFHTNLRGLYFCAQRAARLMVEQQIKGVIVHISSNHSQGTWSHSTVYAAAKAGVNKLTKNMALDLAEYGIRVVGIAPGYTLLEKQRDERALQHMASISSRIPLGRFATPEEVGEAAVYLSSPAAAYITGTTLEMDGGALLPVWADQS